jgi:hypothetical protein
LLEKSSALSVEDWLQKGALLAGINRATASESCSKQSEEIANPGNLRAL